MAVAGIALAVSMWGCGEKQEPETQASKQAAQQAGSGWTKEQLEAFNKAHENARSGNDSK